MHENQTRDVIVDGGLDRARALTAALVSAALVSEKSEDALAAESWGS